MIQKSQRPADIEERLSTLGQALERCSGVVFAYLFGEAFESLALREFFDFRIFEHRLLARRYGAG